MSKIICRICLRTDIKTQDIDEALVDFHDEITEYAIYENKALKYCAVCEHLLLKFYKFTQKCRKAHKILNNLKKKRKGVFPSNLHELLEQSLRGCSSPTISQFNINNDNVEPLSEELVIKQEKPEDVLGNDLDSQQANMKHKTFELVDIDLEDEVKFEENDNPLSLLEVQSTFEKTKKSVERNTNKIDVEQEHYSNDPQEDDYLSDLQEVDHNEDSSDMEMINEIENRIQAAQDYEQLKTMRKKGSPINRPRPKQPLKNMKELEKIFEIHLFPTDQDAKDELELRKASEPYLSAEYKCPICYIVFKYSKKLEFHMRWHDASAGEYECNVCKMRFHSRASVTNHKNGAHYGKFKCRSCPLVTYYKMVMVSHYQCHAGVIFTCKICYRTFNHSSTYKTHMRMRHTTEHVCVTCARSFVSQKGLLAHRNLKHNTNSIVDEDATARCAPCGLAFANEQVYTVHVMNTAKHKDLANSIIACKECGARFGNREDLRVHKRSQHTQHNAIKTKLCTRTKNTNNSNKKTYECAICGVEGTSNLWVLKHVAHAHPDSPYAADLAKRRRHMCETCGKCYTTIYALRDHINTHSGTKPFPCKKCPARFTSSTNLRLHKEFHSPAKRVCTHCGKKFVSASNLSNHMRSHIQDRRYKCSLCHKGFLYPATLREHVRGVHNNVRRVRKLVKRETAARED